MDLDLRGKNAMVCGSTQGIGRACAHELAALGASITLVARNEERLKAVVEELGDAGKGKHDFLVADFERPEELKQKLKAFTERRTFHILVNNTGGPPPGKAIDADTGDYIQAFSNHLLCNQVLVQSLFEGMKRAEFGRIINIISTSVKMPIRGLGVSNTIRGAVANWAKTLSIELGPFGITVNNVLPGATMTGRLRAIISKNAEKGTKSEDEVMEDMIREIPVGRIAEPSEVAAAVAFLASPAAAYINGINLPVDGGRTGTL